jgi:hypothetical protein
MTDAARTGATIMKVTVENLGAIQHAELDLKPLTILIGPNNAGKTWMAYAIAGIFGHYGWRKYTDAYIQGDLTERYPPLDEAITKVLTDGTAALNLVEFAEAYGEAYFQHVADYSRQWMPDFMSTQFAAFDNMRVIIDMQASKNTFLEYVKQAPIKVGVAKGAFTINKTQGDPLLRAYTAIEDEATESDKIPPDEVKGRLIRRVTQLLHDALYANVHVYPTERTTFVTFHYGNRLSIKTSQAFNEKSREISEILEKAIQQVAEQLTEVELTNLPASNEQNAIGPVSYFLNMLSDIFEVDSRKSRQREREAQRSPQIQKYLKLSAILENQVLGGHLNFSTPEPDVRRDILFYPLQNQPLEMPIVSSMVKELAPLALYLCYLAEPDDLLIIDEPEMNLHPEAQAQMIEFLAMLVNAGLRVLITTHSPYMVDHLVNLMHAAKQPQEKQSELAEIFFLQNPDAFIAQDSVSVYCVENGTAENILRDDGKIEWHTFGDISNQIANIYSAM